jgi:hypothetical protein
LKLFFFSSFFCEIKSRSEKEKVLFFARSKKLLFFFFFFELFLPLFFAFFLVPLFFTFFTAFFARFFFAGVGTTFPTPAKKNLAKKAVKKVKNVSIFLQVHLPFLNGVSIWRLEIL